MAPLLPKIALAIAAASSLVFSIPSVTVYTRLEELGIVAEVTGYNSDPAQTDNTPFVTASGAHVHEGTIACPEEYPFGTVLKIDGKRYICEDRMNERFPDRFDIWMTSKEEAIEWGVKKIKVIIES